METLLPILCLLAGSLLPLVAIFLVLRRALRQLRSASAYREVSQRLGLAVDTRGVSLRGYVDERRIWVGELMEGYGAKRLTRVRGVVGLRPPLGLGLLIRRRGRSERLLRRGKATAKLGVPELDRAYEVRADHPEVSEKLLSDGRVRDAFRRLTTRWPEITVTDEDAQVDLPQPEESAERLHDLLSSMLQLAHALEQARGAMEPPPGLREWLQPWGELARELKLNLDPSLPALSGKLEGHRAFLYTRRSGDGYTACLELRFARLMGLGLLIRPQLEPGGSWSVGQNIEVGDPPFDNAFVVKGYDPTAVRKRLEPELRRHLLELSRIGTLLADDRALHLYDAPLEPAPLARAVQAAVKASRALTHA